MEIVEKAPTVKNPPERFTGDAWVDPIAGPREPGQRLSVARVRFAPGARSAWHSTSAARPCTCSRDGTVLEVRPGQTVYTPAGEEHWHGATRDDFMEHLAVMENGDDPATTTRWLEHVSDEDYHRP